MAIFLNDDDIAEIFDMQENDMLSPMIKFLNCLHNGSEEKDGNVATRDVVGKSSLEFTANVKEHDNEPILETTVKDVKRFCCKTTKEDTTEDLQEAYEVMKLREAVQVEHESINALYFELEEERKASAVAAKETMAMISRLQNEKSVLEMEARQYKRMVEEKASYDLNAFAVLQDILLGKEEEKLALIKELELYKRKLFSDGGRSWSREGIGSPPGKGMEMTMLVGTKNNNESCNDQVGCSVIDQSSNLVSTPTIPFNDQARANEIYTYEEEGEAPRSKNESCCRGQQPSNGSATFPSRTVALGDGKLEEKHMAVGQYSDEKGMNCHATASNKADDSSDFGIKPRVNQPFHHKDQYQMLGLPRSINVYESRKHPAGRAWSNNEQEKIVESRESHTGFSEKGFVESDGVIHSQISSYKSSEGASNAAPRGVKLEDASVIRDFDVWNTGMPFSRAANDKVWGATHPVLNLHTVDRKLQGSSDHEETFLPFVHDVYEVKRERYENLSDNHCRKPELIIDQKYMELPEGFDEGCVINAFRQRSQVSTNNGTTGESEEYSQRLALELGGSNQSSLQVKWIENDTPRILLGENLGKPDSSSSKSTFLDKTDEKMGELNKRGERRMAALFPDTENPLLFTDFSVQDDDSHAYLHPFDSLPKHYSNGESYSKAFEDDSYSKAFEVYSTSVAHNQIKQLTLRLQSLEQEREFLKQTIVILKKRTGEMQIMQKLSQQPRRIHNTQSEIRNVKGSSSTSLEGSALSKLRKLAYWFLKAVNTGASLTDPVGLAYTLAKAKLQAPPSVTSVKVENAPPQPWQPDEDTDAVLMAQNASDCSTDGHSVGHAYNSANKVKVEATSCVSPFRDENVPWAWQHDEDSDVVLMAQTVSNWPTDAHGLSETAFNGWDF